MFLDKILNFFKKKKNVETNVEVVKPVDDVAVVKEDNQLTEEKVEDNIKSIELKALDNIEEGLESIKEAVGEIEKVLDHLTEKDKKVMVTIMKPITKSFNSGDKIDIYHGYMEQGDASIKTLRTYCDINDDGTLTMYFTQNRIFNHDVIFSEFVSKYILPEFKKEIEEADLDLSNYEFICDYGYITIKKFIDK